MYLSGSLNSLSDSLSEHFATDHKWELHSSVMDSIFIQWTYLPGHIRLLDRQEVQHIFFLGQFSSNNAILLSWPDHLNYAFLLFHCFLKYYRRFHRTEHTGHSHDALIAQEVLCSGSPTVSLWTYSQSTFMSSHISWLIPTWKLFTSNLGIWMVIESRMFLFPKCSSCHHY